MKKTTDYWLLNAEVQHKIEYIKGRWEVSLIFIDCNNPNQILVHQIGDYRSKRLAEIAGLNMQKTAEKDARGTQKVNSDAYHFNNN